MVYSYLPDQTPSPGPTWTPPPPPPPLHFARTASFSVNTPYNPISNLIRAQVLDRPIGTPVLTSGVWSITDPDLTRVGWAPISAITNVFVPSAAIPEGAVFFYNLPQLLLTNDIVAYNAIDNPGISDAEKAQAKLLLQTLPPVPLAFNFLYVNGTLMEAVDTNPIDGIYQVTSYGIWWFSATDGTQPWSSDLPSDWVPADWTDDKGADRLRSLMNLQFSTSNLILTSC